MRECADEIDREKYVDIDKEIVSVQSLTDDQIIDAVTNNDESSGDDSEPVDNEPSADVSITTKQAQVYIQMVQACVERSENVPDSVFKAFSDINKHKKKQQILGLKQSKIQEFCSKLNSALNTKHFLSIKHV